MLTEASKGVTICEMTVICEVLSALQSQQGAGSMQQQT